MRKRFVITGPTGAVGVGLIEACIENGTEVYALVRPDSKRLWQIPKDPLVHVLPVELQNLQEAKEKLSAKLAAALRPGDFLAFYHLAWEGTFGNVRNDMELQVRNISCTLDVVRLAEALGCKTFIGAGSQAEYGRVEGMLTPKTPAFPENGYGMAKLCAGQMSRELCRELGMKHIWARILSVYGPCDGKNTMIMSTIRQLMEKKRPSFTKGEQQWDYLYAKDAGRALYLLSEKGQDGAVYCLGSGQARPLKEYIKELRDTVRPDAKLGFGDIPYGSRQVMELCADISSLTRDTGFVPQYSFTEGIRETCAWVKENLDRL